MDRLVGRAVANGVVRFDLGLRAMPWLVLAASLLLPQASGAAAYAPTKRTFALLDPPEGPRTLSAPGAGMAVAGGVESVYWNPAALVGQGWRAELGYSQALAGVSTQGLGFTAPGPWGIGLGFDLRYASFGEFERRDSLGYEQGTRFQPWMLAARAGLGTSLGAGRPSLGFSMGWLASQFDQQGSTAGEFVGSVQWDLARTTAVFGRVQSSGGRREALGGAAGGSWSPDFGENHGLRLIAQAEVSQSSETALGISIEYRWLETLTARLGQAIKFAEGPEGWDGFGAGFGVAWNAFGLDYGLRSHGELGWAQALQIGFRFGGHSTDLPAPLAEARNLARAGRPKEALWIYFKHLQASPNDVQALLEMGDLYNKVGSTNEARKCFEKILFLEPSNSDALERLGKLGN